jgi:hypothetical protein
MNPKLLSFLVLSIALLSVNVNAQNNSAPQTSGSSAAASTTGTGNTTLRGCLTGGAGTYMLLDKASGVGYILKGGEDLSRQLNHELAVTGQTLVSNSQSQAASGAVPATINNFQVQSVQEIADHCQRPRPQ